MILLLDTSSSHLSIGIADRKGTLLREFHADAAAGERGIHDARLALEAAKLMKELGISGRQIERIGLIIGPGSFTGLRIGLSFAKGFCVATGAGIVPLTQQEVMFAEAEGFSEAVEPGDCVIVTPGYREDLFYVSESSEPSTIRLLNGEDVSEHGNVPMLLHEYFLLHPSPFLSHSMAFVSPSVFTMAGLASRYPAPLYGLEIDALEPLYLTEFNTTV